MWPSAQDAGAVGGGTSLLYKVPGWIWWVDLPLSLDWIP